MRNGIKHKVIIHECKTGDKIRVIKSETGEAWFNAIDILKIVGLEWGGHMLDRLSVFETKRINCQGNSMRFVNTTGLFSLLAPKHEYLRARKAIVELIVNYSQI